ncbi:beta strand repeat-containing protein [Methylosinus sporium]|uniref:beta strand repeat-containing protein n=1 Tax=Methylosinus sporium TaxID=428 RepID=UPI00383BECB8
MTISKELMLALIESDLYYTGDGASLGTATVSASSVSQTTPGFYSAVYTIGDGVDGIAPGTKVIAYRGLADGGGLSTFQQIFGNVSAQGLQALSAYNAEVAALGGDSSTVLLDGFSLGGGLAGFVASLTGAEAVLFNNIDYIGSVADYIEQQNSAYAIEELAWVNGGRIGPEPTPPPPYNPGPITAYSVYGDIASIVRQNPTTPIYTYAGIQSPGALHQIALLVIYAYGQDTQDWHAIGPSLFSAITNSNLCNFTNLAYTVLDQGITPFGRTGIASLFADANRLGRAVSVAQLSQATQKALTEILVQYAGDETAYAGAHNGQDSPTANKQGAFAGSSNSVMKVDINPTDFPQTYSAGTSTIVGVTDLLDSTLSDALGTSPNSVAGAGASSDAALLKFIKDNQLTQIDLDLTGSTIDTTTPGFALNSFIVGPQTTRTVVGDGNNLIIGGQSVTLGNGNNIVLGQAGNETITIGGGNNVVIASGSGNTINVEAAGHTGINVVYAGGGGDTVNFDVGSGRAGFVILRVPELSLKTLADLDVKALERKISNELSIKSAPFNTWEDYENINTNGLHNVDWTIILTSGAAGGDTITLNGAPITKVSSNLWGNNITFNSAINPFTAITNKYNNVTVGTFDNGYFVSNNSDANPGTLGFNIPISIADYLVQNSSSPKTNSSINKSNTFGVSPVSYVASSSSTNPAMVGPTQIIDTADNVSAELDALAADPNLGSITLTDGGTPTLNLSAARVANDAAALDVITNPSYDIAVADAVANVAAYFTQLGENSHVTSITIQYNGTPTLALTVEQTLSYPNALTEITNSSYNIQIVDSAGNVVDNASQLLANRHVTAVNVVDSAANIVARAAALVADAQVTSIEVNDSLGNVLANASALSALPFGLSVSVVDSAANLADMTQAQAGVLTAINAAVSINVIDSAANLETLTQDQIYALIDNPNLGSVTLTDVGVPTLHLNALQLSSEAVLLNAVANSSYAIDITDSAADVAANIDLIRQNANVASITLTDGNSPTLDLTVVQALFDQSVLSKITNSGYNIQIVDNAANVLNQFYAPQLLANTYIVGAEVVDSAASIISHAVALASDSLVKSVEVSDSIANILANQSALATLPFAISFVIADSAENIAALTPAQINVLVAGGYTTLTSTDGVVSVSAAQAVLLNSAGLSIVGAPVEVSDTAANIAANIDALNADGDIAAVTITDNWWASSLTLTASEVIDDAGIISLVSNRSFAIAVVDSAENVAANINALGTDTLVSAITLTDSGTPTLALSVEKELAASAVLNKITNTSFAVTISDSAANVATKFDALNQSLLFSSIYLTDAGTPVLTLSAAQATNDFGALAALSNSNYSITVVDTAANVAAAMDSLNGLAPLGSIVLSDSGTPTLTLTPAQAKNDAGVLAKIISSYTLSISGGGAPVSVADFFANQSTLDVSGNIAIADIATNIASAFDALSADANVVSIVFTDNGSPALNLTAQQAVNDAAALRKVATTSYTLNVVDTAASITTYLDALSALPLGSIVISDSGALSITLGQLKADSTVIAKLGNADGSAYRLSLTNPTGNITSIAPSIVEQAQTTVIGQLSGDLVGLGLPLVLQQASGALGALSLATDGSNDVLYTAPNTIIASGIDAVSYDIIDARGDVLATGTASVQLDRGPSIASSAPVKVGHGQTTTIGTVTPGLASDTLTLTQTSGSGVVFLQGNVIEYLAPAVVTAGQTDEVAYRVQDQYAAASASAIAQLLLDSGPTAANASIIVGHNQSLDETALLNALITPGLAGDTETIVAVTGHATLSGSTVTYQSPASGTDSFSYTVQDQLGDVATGTVSVTVDPGPTAGALAPTVQFGQSVNLTSAILAAVKPGLSGDNVSIVADDPTGTFGVVTLVKGVVTYAATGAKLANASISGKATDKFGYVITDQYGDVATGTVNVTVNNPITVINGSPYGGATIRGVASNELVNAYGWFNTIYANGGNGTINAGQGNAAVYASSGNLSINLAGYFDIVSGDDGNDIVSGSAGNATVTLGNGADRVSVGGYNNVITLGNGDDVVNLGLGSGRLTIGNGANVIAVAGYNNKVVAGAGANTLTGGDGNGALAFGDGNNKITTGGYNNVIKVGSGDNVIVTGAGGDAVTAGNGNNTITLAGYGNAVSLGNGTNTVNGGAGGDAITVGGGDATLNLYGWNDIATINGGATATINDHGFGLGVKVGSAADHLVINGMSADAFAWIDLLTPAMGYASGSAAFHALQSDGHGGSLLALSGGGAIDIVGVAPNHLSASNFRVE